MNFGILDIEIKLPLICELEVKINAYLIMYLTSKFWLLQNILEVFFFFQLKFLKIKTLLLNTWIYMYWIIIFKSFSYQCGMVKLKWFFSWFKSYFLTRSLCILLLFSTTTILWTTLSLPPLHLCSWMRINHSPSRTSSGSGPQK